MNNLSGFIVGNQHLLNQLRDILFIIEKQKQPIYSSAIPIIGGASIGAHLRHILDFYSSLCFGVIDGEVNYDDRVRNSKIESDINSGLIQVNSTIEHLAQLSSLDNDPIKVFSAVEVNEPIKFTKSTLIRELQSVHSHTTHHMAIIAIILKLNDIPVHKDFGKAPSTVQYERNLAIQTVHDLTSSTSY